MVVALNMSDIARRKGMLIDAGAAVAANSACRWSRPSASRRTACARCWRCSTGRPGVQRRGEARHGGTTPTAADIEHDQAEVRRILAAVGGERTAGITLSDRLDAVVLHPVLGPLILALMLFLVFQAVFAWAQAPMDWIKSGVDAVGRLDRVRRCPPDCCRTC